MSRNVIYWLIQIGVWSFYTLFLIFSFIAFADIEQMATMVIIQVIIGAGLLAASHGIRLAIKKWNLLEFPTSKLIGSTFGLIVGISLLAQIGIQTIVFVLLDLPGTRSFNLAESMVYWANSAFVLLIWTSVYIGIKSFERRQEKEVENWKLQAQLKEAELGILKAQINPHFLFNALNNIRSLISEDAERARNILTRLSEVLRYAVYHNSREEVTLSEEIEMVTNYLELEKIQFEERLQTNIEIDDELSQLRIPPMSIQILVENAIKHGIAKRKSGGEIAISVTKVGRDVRISVINDGEIASRTVAGNPEEGGVGIENLRERLNRAFGTRAAFSLSATGSDQVTATFLIEEAP